MSAASTGGDRSEFLNFLLYLAPRWRSKLSSAKRVVRSPMRLSRDSARLRWSHEYPSLVARSQTILLGVAPVGPFYARATFKRTIISIFARLILYFVFQDHEAD
jgi:hypothetical protein